MATRGEGPYDSYQGLKHVGPLLLPGKFHSIVILSEACRNRSSSRVFFFPHFQGGSGCRMDVIVATDEENLLERVKEITGADAGAPPRAFTAGLIPLSRHFPIVFFNL